MSALFNRAKTWIFQEDVSSSDLNGEFNNILNNMASEMISGHSANVSQMQATTNPGAVGSESLATSISGEIERLRFAIKRILGSSSAQWYSAPPVDLSVIQSAFSSLTALQNGIVSCAVDANGQPMFLIPDGTTNAVTLKCSVTPFVCYIAGIQYTFSSDLTLTGLTVATGSNNTAAVDNNAVGTAFAASRYSKSEGEDDSHDILPGCLEYLYSADSGFQTQPINCYLPLKTIGSAISALDGTQIAFKIGTEYSVGVLRGAGTRLENCMRGFFFSSLNASQARAAFATNDTVTLMKLSYIFLLSGGTLDATYNRPQVGSQAPVSPASGDYWLDTSANVWKKYSGTAFVANNSIPIGWCYQDTTKTNGARSFDIINTYSDQAAIWLRKDALTNTKAISSQAGNVSVYGTTLSFGEQSLDYSVSRDQDASFSSGDFIFFYLSKSGKQVISSVAPHKRMDLGGYYHPSKPYRCLGSSYTANGSVISFGIKNIKQSPAALKTRVMQYPKTLSSAAGSVTLATFKTVFRGGRVKCYFAGALDGSQSMVQVSNSTATAPTVDFNIVVANEYSDTYATLFLGRVVGPASGAEYDIPLSSFSHVDMGELYGFCTVTVTASITSGGGTPSCSMNGLVVLEEVF